ncbi:hypothetical protein [Mucilaginibacter gynuensis]|uniref:hypothetical protein n=1 Tax=Mucilaginibacter gynuensis TaxID=1302236 RepID=UPI0031EA2F80
MAIGYTISIAFSHLLFVSFDIWGVAITAPLIYGGCYYLTRFAIYIVPIKIFKVESLAPGLTILTCLIFFAVFNLLIYDEMNSYDFPNWHFIMIIVVLMYGGLLQFTKSHLMIDSFEKQHSK